jgi:pimeloyl-ACP methyl ester carboxylesterase
MAAAPTRSQVTVNGIAYTYLEAGPAAGPLALCIHGFPDTAVGWTSLLGDLADAGFHAVAPYMRGYAPTSVPTDGGSLSAWIADVLAIRDDLGGDERSVLIGHDWGALTTYGSASAAPDGWRRVVTASIPPSSVMATRLLDYDQLKMFWYQYVFLQPTAEGIVAHDDLEFIVRLWDDWSPGYDATAALIDVKEALRAPENLSAALNTYRCVYGVAAGDPAYAAHELAPFMPHTQPTLYLHGDQDGCLSPASFPEVLAALPEGSRTELIGGAGHFLQYEKPEVVNPLIVDFVSS